MHPYFTEETPAPEITAEYCHELSQWALEHCIFDDVIFATIHGSYLYGTAHQDSDIDIFIVRESGKNKSTNIGNIDVQVLNLETFLRLAQTGCHQAVEALYSPYKKFSNTPYRPFIEHIRVSPYAFSKKALSAAKALQGRGTSKGAQHAHRLEESAQQMLCGEYSPIWKDYDTSQNIARPACL